MQYQLDRKKILQEINQILWINIHDLEQVYKYFYEMEPEEQKLLFAYENQSWAQFDDKSDNYSDDELREILEDIKTIIDKINKGWLQRLEQKWQEIN